MRRLQSVAVVGVGLIGGSIGLAARERLGAHVARLRPRPAVRERRSRAARSTRPAPTLAARRRRRRRVRRRAGPGAGERVAEVLRGAGRDCVVTDVGSTKRAVVAAIDDPRFIGGHPLAGAETAGVEHARADLFEGATWYLTPTRRTRAASCSSACTASSPASARARRRSTPTTHDRLMARRLAPAARARQRARRAGGARARRRGDPGDRPELPRRDARRRRQPAAVGAASTVANRRRARSTAIDETIARLAAVARAAGAGDGDGAGGLAGDAPRDAAPRAAGGRRWPAARCASCASSCPTARASSPSSRSPSAARHQHPRHEPLSPQRRLHAAARSPSGWPRTTPSARASSSRRSLGAMTTVRVRRPSGRAARRRSRRRPTSRSPTARRCSARWPPSPCAIAQLPRRRRHALDAGRGARARRAGRAARDERRDDPRRRPARGARARRADRRRQRRHADAAAAGLAGRRRTAARCTLDGDASIRRRPVDRIAEPLRADGRADRGDRRPLRRRSPCTARALRGDRLRAAGRLAQVKSCVLLAGAGRRRRDDGHRAGAAAATTPSGCSPRAGVTRAPQRPRTSTVVNADELELERDRRARRPVARPRSRSPPACSSAARGS